MNEFDNYFGKESVSEYSQDDKQSEDFKQFLSYIADKKVALGIVKCKG